MLLEQKGKEIIELVTKCNITVGKKDVEKCTIISNFNTKQHQILTL